MHGTQGKETSLLTQLRQRCRKRDATLQEGHGKERSQGPWRTREESQAGDRDRTVEGAQEGQEGPEEGVEAEERQEDSQEIIAEIVEEIIKEIVEAQIQQALTLTCLRSCCPA